MPPRDDHRGQFVHLAPITVNSGGTLSAWGISAPVANNITLNDGTVGTAATDAGAVTFSGTITLNKSVSPVVNGGSLTGTSTGNTTFSGQIIGTGLLTLSGTNTVSLTNTNNTWSGGTTINIGTLQIGDGGANGSLPSVGTITLGTSVVNSTTYTGTLLLNSASDLSVPNYITGTGGALTQSGSGTTTLSGVNDFTGTVTVNGSGALRLTNSGALGSSTATIAGGTSTCRIELTNSVTIQQSMVLTGRSAQTAPHIINISGSNSISGALSFATGGNQYVVQSNPGAGNKLTLNTVYDGLTTDRYLVLTGGGDGEVTGGIYYTASTGALHVVKDGTGIWTLSGVNAYNGNTTVKTGTLAFKSSSMSGTLESSMLIDVKSGATLDVTGISGGLVLGSLGSAQTQTQTLSGSGTIVGSVTTTPGLTSTTPAVPLSAVAPGGIYSLGTMTVNGDLTFAGSGDAIDYDINGANGDLINVNGNLTLGGSTGSETNLAISILGKPTASTYTVAAVTDPSKTLTGTAITANIDTRYTFTPSVNTAAKTITLSVSGSNASLIWNSSSSGDLWDVKTSTIWKNGANPADMYYNADDVTFDNTATNTTVILNSTVLPASVTFNSSANYTLTGTGKISGSTGLVKDGNGSLSISTSNDYTGQTEVKNGVLHFGDSAAFTSLTNNIVVDNGASLDIQAYSGGPTAITVPIKIAGAGYNGQGALYVSVGPSSDYSIVNKLELTGDATISTGASTRWDMANPSPGDPTTGYIKGNGYTLTKIGAYQIWLKQLGDIGVGDININAGRLGLQQIIGAGDPSKTITVASAASLGLWDTGQYQVIYKKLDFKDGSGLYSGGGTVGNFLSGDEKLEGNVSVQTDVNLTLTGNITGAGGITKSGTAILILAGTQNFSGATTINTGTLQLSGSGTIGDVANPTTLEVLNGSHTVGNVTGAGSMSVDAGASLTAMSVAQNTITIGPGATLTIAAIPGGPSASFPSISPVPEPSTWAMLMLAAMGLVVYWRRRR